MLMRKPLQCADTQVPQTLKPTIGSMAGQCCTVISFGYRI